MVYEITDLIIGLLSTPQSMINLKWFRIRKKLAFPTQDLLSNPLRYQEYPLLDIVPDYDCAILC